MVIYLTHPQHGAKVAISELEAEADELNGWVRCNESDLTHKADTSTVENAMAKKRRRVSADESL